MQLAEIDHESGDQLGPEVLALWGPPQPEEVAYTAERKASTSSNRTMSPVAAKPGPPPVSPKVCRHCGFWIRKLFCIVLPVCGVRWRWCLDKTNLTC